MSVGSQSALTPPPRVITMKDKEGNEVVAEWGQGFEQAIEVGLKLFGKSVSHPNITNA